MKFEKSVEFGKLYDVYGSLLSERQQNIFEDYYLNDLTLSEIADGKGITRQAVLDILRQCEKKLLSYDQRLNLKDFHRNYVDSLSSLLSETNILVIKEKILKLLNSL